jgi:lipoate-protein ligase A
MFCRLFIDPAASGAWNMAVDETLLESAAAGDGTALRFYRWQEPTLSLGYFQPYSDRRQHPASRDCPAVRRVTGGGAILHDREITYSFAVPPDHRLAIKHLELYENAHAALIAALATYGIRAAVCPGQGREKDLSGTFLCFQRRSAGDVLLGDVKIAGSAQRRSRKAVLQHGSLLLARSPLAPELAGLVDLTPSEFFKAPASQSDFDQLLTHAWWEEMAERFSIQWQPGRLTDQEQQRAAELVREKYDSDQWTRNR